MVSQLQEEVTAWLVEPTLEVQRSWRACQVLPEPRAGQSRRKGTNKGIKVKPKGPMLREAPT